MTCVLDQDLGDGIDNIRLEQIGTLYSHILCDDFIMIKLFYLSETVAKTISDFF